MRYILQHRKTQSHRGKPVTVRELRLGQLRDAEADIAKFPPPADGYGAQARALWAMGVTLRIRQARQEAGERWQRDIEHAAARFLVLARNHADYLSVHQNADPVILYGLPEWLEGTVPASANPGLVEQAADSPGYSPTVIRLLRALRGVYTGRMKVSNYGGHARSNMYVGDVEGVGEYSFDVHLHAAINDDGFYEHAAAVGFFLALDQAARATDTAWVAYYNDFAVMREVNERLHKLRIGFVGADTPRQAKPGEEASLHHGPEPYILHIHVNVMPKKLAAQFFASHGVTGLPSVDLSAPQ
jgi:hypothetical protein